MQHIYAKKNKLFYAKSQKPTLVGRYSSILFRAGRARLNWLAVLSSFCWSRKSHSPSYTNIFRLVAPLGRYNPKNICICQPVRSVRKKWLRFKDKRDILNT